MCTSNDHESWARTESEQELGQGWLVLDWLLAYPLHIVKFLISGPVRLLSLAFKPGTRFCHTDGTGIAM